MNLPHFEKLDEFWTRRAARWQKRRVSPQILSGFAESVVARIREQESEAPAPARRTNPWNAWAAALTPIAVGVLVFSLVSTQRFLSPDGFEGARSFELASADAALVAEMEALRELGAWTEEDETAVAGDGLLELSRADRAATLA